MSPNIKTKQVIFVRQLSCRIKVQNSKSNAILQNAITSSPVQIKKRHFYCRPTDVRYLTASDKNSYTGLQRRLSSTYTPRDQTNKID